MRWPGCLDDLGGEVVTTQIIPGHYGVDLYCGQSQGKNILEAFWALLLSLLLLRRGSSTPGVVGLSRKGQEMEDVGRTVKD